jgi:hypothetical protein
MRLFFVGGILSVMRALGGLEIGLSGNKEKKVHGSMESSARVHFLGVLKSYSDDLMALGMSASHASLERIVNIIENDGEASELQMLCTEITGRLSDESGARTFFALSPREGEFYNSARAGWEKTIDRFPAVLDDVEEAAKCFALSRYPAAVFHSIQVVEVGLIELGTFINVNDPHSGWTAVSSKLVQILRKSYNDLSEFEKANRPFLEQVGGTVEALKSAWRNKISHAQGRLTLISKEFSPEIAEEILFATRSFMRRLTEGLPPKPFDPATASLAVQS